MSFAAKMHGFAIKTTREVEAVKRVVAIKLFGAIIEDTPVLTGRLRGNWQTTIRSPALDELPIRDGSAAMDDVAKVAGEAKGDDTIIFRNNLPYAARIEFEGWSHTKAPQGMVRKNVLLFQQNVKNAIARGTL